MLKLTGNATLLSMSCRHQRIVAWFRPQLSLCDYEAVGKSTHIQHILPISDTSLSILGTMTLTWAEDKATRARDLSADPGARPDGAGTMPAFFTSGMASRR